MDANPGILDNLYDKAKVYAEVNLELYKLKAVEKSAHIVSELASKFILSAFVLLCFFVFNIGLSIYLGDVLGKMHYGFFMISGFYMVLTLVFYVFRRKWIKTPVRNSVITAALNIDKS